MATIDCDTCPARGRHCGDCVVPLLLGDGWGSGPTTDRHLGGGADRGEMRLDRAERAAVGMFVRAGLLAPAAADRLRAAPAGRGLSAVG